MQDFQKLRVWQRAQSLTVAIHAATQHMSGAHAAGLRSQLRRAAASIAANIAEGAAQATPAQFARFLQVAIGSAAELRSHLDLARRLGTLPEARCVMLEVEAEELTRMLVVLVRRVRQSTTAR